MARLHPHRGDSEFMFTWPLIADVLPLCAATAGPTWGADPAAVAAAAANQPASGSGSARPASVTRRRAAGPR